MITFDPGSGDTAKMMRGLELLGKKAPPRIHEIERLLPSRADRAADAGAEIPAGDGKITLVRPAGALCNIGEIGGDAPVRVEGGKFVLARRREAAGGVDDTGPNRGGNASAADDVPIGMGI